MSTTLFPNDTLFTQRMLKVEGLYTGRLDGIWGPLTEQAANEFELLSEKVAEEYGRFDQRTETNIRTLTLQAQKEARKFMNRIKNVGAQSPGRSGYSNDASPYLTIKIISGTRSYAEQNKLFRQGRYHNPGPIITHARGGYSAHNFGIAWDIGIFTESKGYIPGGSLYEEVAKTGLSDALEWGGSWPTFVDRSHFQLKLMPPIQIVRQRFEDGEQYLQIA